MDIEGTDEEAALEDLKGLVMVGFEENEVEIPNWLAKEKGLI